jgi:CheY-like chemotaxis protein
MLKTLGYQVFVAATGQEGIDCYRQHGEEIALVILDMVMPGMSGEAVFEALRNLDPEVKVVLSTGYSLQDMAQEVFSAGCRGFIQKPFTLQSLSRKIREVLDSTE